jgi:hypothetical protein
LIPELTQSLSSYSFYEYLHRLGTPYLIPSSEKQKGNKDVFVPAQSLVVVDPHVSLTRLSYFNGTRDNERYPDGVV